MSTTARAWAITAFARAIRAGLRKHGFRRRAARAGTLGPEQKDELFTEAAQLKTDFMERQSIARADYLVSPGRHLPAWLAKKVGAMPPRDRCLLIGQPCHELAAALAPALGPVLGSTLAEAAPPQPPVPVSRCQRSSFPAGMAMTKGSRPSAMRWTGSPPAEAARIQVTFPGRFGQVGNEHSGSVLAARGRRWHFGPAFCPLTTGPRLPITWPMRNRAGHPSPFGDATQARCCWGGGAGLGRGRAPDLLAGDLRSR